MEAYAVDLHMHTALSPCGSEEMTPNNIIHMAALKGLDILSITDHNAIGNVLPCMKIGYKHDVVVIPGIEITTQEEVHLLAYFSTYEKLSRFFQALSVFQSDMKNRPSILGNQFIFDTEDNVICEETKLLMNALQISFDETVKMIRKFDGAPVPAHINRNSFSVLSSLGFLPNHLDIQCIELFGGTDTNSFLNQYPEYKRYRHLKSSDAHSLANIMERIFFVELKKRNAEDMIQWMLNKR